MFKKNKKKIIIIIISLVLVILLSISLLIERTNNTFLKDISISINKIVMYPFTSLNKNKGINQTESYLIQKNINSSLESSSQDEIYGSR